MFYIIAKGEGIVCYLILTTLHLLLFVPSEAHSGSNYKSTHPDATPSFTLSTSSPKISLLSCLQKKVNNFFACSQY